MQIGLCDVQRVDRAWIVDKSNYCNSVLEWYWNNAFKYNAYINF